MLKKYISHLSVPLIPFFDLIIIVSAYLLLDRKLPHGMDKLHKSMSSSRPLQSSPPYAGGGLVHDLWRVFRAISPGPSMLFLRSEQDFEQADQAVHSVQPPS